MSDCDVRVYDESTTTVVGLIGELRLRCEPLDIALSGLQSRHRALIVFDCAELSFLSSLGMGMIVACYRNAKLHHGRVRLAAVQPEVLESLKRARLLDLLEHFPTVAAATAP